MKQVQSITLLTQNQRVKSILEKIHQVVDSDSSILLIGATGVGKELFAEYIHRTSSRGSNPFVKVGLNAIPSELLESELFGHEKGAFTSATYEKKGLFELANGGSIFLDDIDDFPLHLQTKLLRVLESREIMRIGGVDTIQIDVRLITASKIDLKDLVNAGKFRADLFYRINVVPIQIPPLRERPEDIPLIFHHYLKHYAPYKELTLSNEALKQLIQYNWPGNIRELRNTAQRLSLFSFGEIKESDLPSEIREANPVQLLIKACNHCFSIDGMTFQEIVACLEHNLISEALKQNDNNQSAAARKLGLSLSTLRDKIKKYNLS